MASAPTAEPAAQSAAAPSPFPPVADKGSCRTVTRPVGQGGHLPDRLVSPQAFSHLALIEAAARIIVRTRWRSTATDAAAPRGRGSVTVVARAYGWPISLTAVTSKSLLTRTSTCVPSDFVTCAS